MIKFFYKNCKHNTDNEKIVKKIIDKIRPYLSLPDMIVIEFVNLDHSIYAETIVDRKTKNTIRINALLTAKELIKPVVHELIHLNQIYTGRLNIYRNGSYFWEGKMIVVDILKLNYQDYQQLPWEIDVAEREHDLLNHILN